jgi:hypothetical protein
MTYRSSNPPPQPSVRKVATPCCRTAPRKARYELFQVGPEGRPIAPQPWATYDAASPCGADVNGRAKTLASFEPFMDFNQFRSDGAANPLVAQNRTYTRP